MTISVESIEAKILSVLQTGMAAKIAAVEARHSGDPLTLTTPASYETEEPEGLKSPPQVWVKANDDSVLVEQVNGIDVSHPFEVGIVHYIQSEASTRKYCRRMGYEVIREILNENRQLDATVVDVRIKRIRVAAGFQEDETLYGIAILSLVVQDIEYSS